MIESLTIGGYLLTISDVLLGVTNPKIPKHLLSFENLALFTWDYEFFECVTDRTIEDLEWFLYDKITFLQSMKMKKEINSCKELLNEAIESWTNHGSKYNKISDKYKMQIVCINTNAGFDFHYTYNDWLNLATNLLNRINEFENNKPLKIIEFVEIFKEPYNTDKKQNELFDKLRYFEYIDENDKWIGKTPNKNELAQMYHFFTFNSEVVVPDSIIDKETKIRVLYRKFNIPIKSEFSKVGTTIRNLTTPRPNSKSYKNFEKHLIDWID